MKFCIECENEFVIFGKTTIKVGEKECHLEADHCTECGAVYLSPKDQEKIDTWGNELTTVVKETQPYFSKDVYERTKMHAHEYGLKWPEFIKVCTAFYLFRMTKDKNFKEVRQVLMASAAENFSIEANKIKHSVPIRYRLFKQMQLYAEVWAIREPNVIEEAMLCCIALLESRQARNKAISEKKEQLREYVEEYSTAS